MTVSDAPAAAASRVSARSLALLFAGHERRVPLAALYDIEADIAAAARPRVEHAVAHAKLTWWRGEVDRLAAGRPQHPASRALLAAAGHAPDYNRLHERLAGADLVLAGFVPSSARELEALLYRTHGAVQQLAAQVCGAGPAAALDVFGAELGRALGLLDTLGSAVAAAPPDRERPAELWPAALAARARVALAAADSALTPAERTGQSHGCVLAALAAAELARAARRGDAIPGRYPARAALADLWIAWRAARRAVAGKGVGA